ncbi:ABC-type transport auxiliary lipoprotein family protein [Sphingomonas sp. DT-204]|uniref:ABC-type transport auxiliary lipoprotein family protein n=1 Tax=Sphingomonas sp. DT-204 TaxID=3396166 RepID=UPI003F1CB5AD
MKKPAILALLPLAAAVAGCIRFGAEPPPSLLTLNSQAAPQSGAVQGGGTPIAIVVPSAPQEIATQRVPVRATGTSIAYVKDAVWVEQPARLFARLLSDTLTARANRMVVSGRQALSNPGAILGGELRSFGVEASSNEAVVIYDASLTREQGDKLEKRRFEARVPVSAVEPGPVGVALNQAANQVATEVADWVGR